MAPATPYPQGKRITVTFEGVGRGRVTWSERLPDHSEATLYRAVRRRGVLGSRGIDFTEMVNDDGVVCGDIYVGGFRHVGTWRVEREDSK